MNIEEMIIAIALLLLGLVLKMLNSKIEKAKPKGEFDEYKQATEKRLHRGSDRFDKIEGKVDGNTNKITEIETILKLWGAKKK